MPVDKGTSGRDPAVPVRRKRRQPVERPKVVGENASDKARAPRSPAVRAQQRRNQDVEAQYGTGGAGGNQQAPGLVGTVLGPVAEGAAWAFTHPKQRLTGDVPAKFVGHTTINGHAAQMASLEFPWGPGRGFFRARAAAKAVAPPPEVIPGADKIVASLGDAKKARLQQEKLYRQERGKRISEADALASSIGGIEGHHAALKALAGELPKLRFGGLEGAFDEKTVVGLFKHINEHPDLRKFERVRARDGVLSVLAGKVPTRNEIQLFEKAFGPETAADLKAAAPFWKKAYNTGLEIMNVPRALQASVDLSAPFRQALVLGARHPVMFAREFKPMLKAAKSEHAYEDILDDIANRPTFEAMKRAKLAITDLGQIGTREEAFASNLAETLTGGSRSPVRMSSRAYTGFLNKFRADAFDHYLKVAEDAGYDIKDERLLTGIANWVNHATGRGSLKNFEAAMKPLNALFFSPRLMASRLQLLNPAYYARLHPFARKQALRGVAQLAGSLALTLYMAKMAGARVGVDPRSSDFGKIRVGDTRLDIAGGFQQYLVAAYRIAKGESVSAATGKLTRLEGGFAKQSRADIALRFGEQKFAPVPGFVDSFLKDENFQGEPFDAKREGLKLLAPIGITNTYETVRDEGPGVAVPAAALGAIGFGVQTFPDKAVPSSAGDGGGSVYARRRSGGGSPYARRTRGGGSKYAH